MQQQDSSPFGFLVNSLIDSCGGAAAYTDPPKYSGRPTDYRIDGDFYIRRICERCGDGFYVYALQNTVGDYEPNLCPFCKSERTAAEQSRDMVAIEAQYGR